jgi:hypothetical protein
MIAPKSHPPGWRNTLSAIAPPALLMAFIFWIGTDRGSATETRSFLESLLQSWWPSLAERLGLEGFRLINVIVRKLGHFLGYGLLGLLNARCLQLLRGTLTRNHALQAWAAAAAWAAVDEFHQSYSPSRGATVEDVLLDASGAAVGIFFYSLWLLRHPRNSPSPK